jgi:hypothetical protein
MSLGSLTGGVMISTRTRVCLSWQAELPGRPRSPLERSLQDHEAAVRLLTSSRAVA